MSPGGLVSDPVSALSLGIALVAREPQFLNPSGSLRGGDNMAAIHLSHVVAGDLFLGFISAVAFATILAVVSGPTLSGASAIALGVVAVVLDIAFEG